MSGQAIVGRKQNTEYDFYETPSWATKKIVKKLISDGVLNTKTDKIHECCCGAGAISKVLEECGFKCYSSDVQNAEYIYGDVGKNVYDLPNNFCENIITNPPYDLMTKESMLNEFLRISTGKVILLLNVFFLSSGARKELLENSPLKYVYMHSERVTMYPYGTEEPKNGGTKMFAWYVWERGYIGEPIIRWV